MITPWCPMRHHDHGILHGFLGLGNDSHIIHIKIARRMTYAKDNMSGLVQPKLLYEAANKFVRKPVPLEEGIELNKKFKVSHYQNEDNHNYDLTDDEHFVRNAIYETMLTIMNKPHLQDFLKNQLELLQLKRMHQQLRIPGFSKIWRW